MVALACTLCARPERRWMTCIPKPLLPATSASPHIASLHLYLCRRKSTAAPATVSSQPEEADTHTSGAASPSAQETINKYRQQYLQRQQQEQRNLWSRFVRWASQLVRLLCLPVSRWSGKEPGGGGKEEGAGACWREKGEQQLGRKPELLAFHDLSSMWLRLVCSWVRLRWYQYEMSYGPYMLDRWERLLVLAFIVSVMSLTMYGAYNVARRYALQ